MLQHAICESSSLASRVVSHKRNEMSHELCDLKPRRAASIPHSYIAEGRTSLILAHYHQQHHKLNNKMLLIKTFYHIFRKLKKFIAKSAHFQKSKPQAAFTCSILRGVLYLGAESPTGREGLL